MNLEYNKLFIDIQSRTDIGIGLEILTEKILNTTVFDLIVDKQIINNLLEYRCTYNISLNKTLKELNSFEIWEYLRESILLDYMVPLISRYIELSPLMPGAFFNGEILLIILNIDKTFWAKHRDWYLFFIDIAIDVANNHKEDGLNKEVLDLLTKAVNESRLV